MLHSLCTHNQIIEAVHVWMLSSLSEPWAQSPAPGRKIKVIVVPAKKQVYLRWNLLNKILQLYVRMCSSGMFVEETDHPALRPVLLYCITPSSVKRGAGIKHEYVNAAWSWCAGNDYNAEKAFLIAAVAYWSLWNIWTFNWKIVWCCARQTC